MLPKPLQQLQKFFEKFPGIGPRQASRFVFFLSKQPKEYIESFIQSLQSMSTEVKLCSNCNLPGLKKNNLCTICSDSRRDKKTIYVVEKEGDALNLEKTNIHNGVYFVLGKNISPVEKTQSAKEQVKNLVKKLKRETNPEVILALNNTREGNFTAMYIKEMFKENELNNVTLTSLGRGLSTGSELEYADEETLRNALKNRH
ncbi:MAG: recombination protein RecR [Candidatus Spechtbacteria bacterium RIFCSPLOWO2_12_FULL_38_22]|uniref:Recombination protein RecR n=1 Tax=Candidatus Spechtbacteria bacterium RIFCSPLOWO2_12_FULL_38_22 TaxID=1802165 RepID=A0A1G2HHR8_9BACT|nr:MAG: recombination protein RecR [Candidatus Spechtbacteria bacterium RIFCSPLOWO2_12_FULL_38_22]